MRLFISLVLAFIVSIFLFLGMHFLISSDHAQTQKSKPLRPVQYLSEKKDERVHEKKRVKPKMQIIPKKVKIPTPTTKITTKTQQQTDVKPFKITPQNIQVSSISSLSGAQIQAPVQQVGKFTQASSLSASKRVNPQYPRHAKRRNIQGSVELIFDIDDQGMVQNVRILSQNPKDVFATTSINAIKKWKFSTKATKNVVITFNFRLEK